MPKFPKRFWSREDQLGDNQRGYHQQGGESSRVCFLEYNTEQAAGHELCVGVYNAGGEDPTYYDSYNPVKD